MDSQKAYTALMMISQGFAALAESIGEEAEETPRPTAASSKVTPIAAGRSNKGTTKESKDKEDSPAASSAKGGSVQDSKALAELKALDLDEVTRPEMLPLAKKLGVEVQGKTTAEIRDALRLLVAGGGSGSASSDDEDAASGDSGEVEYPDVKTMKKQMKAWAQAHKKLLDENIGPEYFDDTDDAENPAERLHQTLADEEVLKEQWKDNVWPMIQDGSWKKIEKTA